MQGQNRGGQAMEWGQTEYAQCFQDHVMKWARDWYCSHKPLELPGQLD